SIGAIECDRDTKRNADTLDENPTGALQYFIHERHFFVRYVLPGTSVEPDLRPLRVAVKSEVLYSYLIVIYFIIITDSIERLMETYTWERDGALAVLGFSSFPTEAFA
ncbi:1128_t:CDS:2, partial [Gigaspora rosea]